jgi:hypothetical protein
MINVMRKHHKILMIIITALVCISFSWYWNRTDFARLSNGTVGTFYDRPVTQIELQRQSRLLRLAAQLGMRDLVGYLTTGAQTEAEALENFAWNLMVLRHEADALGIEPTSEEIAEEVKTLPAFKGEKGFDLTAYTNFADHVLGSLGFTEGQIEELAADQIALKRLQKMLEIGVNIPESQMRHDYDQAYAKMQASVVRLDPKNFQNVEISDEEIGKYYDAHKSELTSDEKRQLKVAAFGLTEEQKKLTGKEKIDALQKLADKANDFIEALQAKNADFDQVAAKLGVTTKETGLFSKEAPDPLLAGKPEVTAAAFSLTKEAPNSDALQLSDGFDILHLVKVEPSRPLTKEEARPKIVEALKKQESEQKMAAKGSEIAKQLGEALKNGKTIEQAANDAGVKVEKVPAFSLAERAPGATPPPEPEPKKDTVPDMEYIRRTASTLGPGSVSNFVPTQDGGLIVILEKREQPSDADFEKARAPLDENALSQRGQVVFYEWLRDRRHAAGIPEPKETTAPG